MLMEADAVRLSFSQLLVTVVPISDESAPLPGSDDEVGKATPSFRDDAARDP